MWEEENIDFLKEFDEKRRMKKMSDTSQSRYSIVERLTKEQLSIMDEKQRIEGDIESKRQEIAQIRLRMKESESEMLKELNDKKEVGKEKIQRLEREIASMEKGKNTRAKLCDEKLARLDKALKAIAEISKSSAEEAKK